MNTFICFGIAMAGIYIMRLLTGGFNLTELISYILMVGLLGAHVYLCTRKRVVWGIVIPVLIVISFYPMCRVMRPSGTVLAVLIGLYAAALGSCLYIWSKARKDIQKKER